MLKRNKGSRRRFLGTTAMTLAATQFGALASAKTWFGGGSELASLTHATTWLNSQPLTFAELQGKVVLVDFWTYSCINWRRQLPYVRAWAEKYKDEGWLWLACTRPNSRLRKPLTTFDGP